MSKGLKPGYLYILSDVDQRTGTASPYYKIGITFESKTVEERIKEHHKVAKNQLKIVIE